eukprot:2913641-Pyramimonas_sp.AAC.1
MHFHIHSSDGTSPRHLGAGGRRGRGWEGEIREKERERRRGRMEEEKEEEGEEEQGVVVAAVAPRTRWFLLPVRTVTSLSCGLGACP